jgi:hypothetical protein
MSQYCRTDLSAEFEDMCIVTMRSPIRPYASCQRLGKGGIMRLGSPNRGGYTMIVFPKAKKQVWLIFAHLRSHQDLLF